ncbi:MULTISPECIES: EAL domain-containing protein [unclassified Caballeronia]|uniref:EAL domain-containing protein n=1 Tax=unclassified Caballeronia TaxID=2646786 RepID=UPI00285A6A66|nr:MULTISPECIES: EAL domain-containing protein [unclassified Caballeronia]MDR5739798.1 EAL domain-containing protein [Caballeronia sp. LZ016]MDR5808262.1 EAL domain-containing protein [Caballeronia sp. LZ019]
MPGDAVVDGIALSTHLQPIYSLPHQRAIGYEALLRGRAQGAGDGPLIGPFDLFARAIVAGTLTGLDRMSHLTHLRNAARRLPAAHWLFVNMNPATFTDAGYAKELAARTRDAGLAPEQLVIEVLESGGTDVERIASATRTFRAQGFLVAVDDFGAGHSNIDRLLTLRPDIVKLDRSLVRAQSALKHAPLRDALMPKLVELLHQSGMFVVAEGIETRDDLLLAARSNVDFVQGFLFGKPCEELAPHGAATPLIEDAFDMLAQTRRNERLGADLLLMPYRANLSQAARRIAGGASMEAACAEMLALPSTVACFFLDEAGRQFSPTLRGAGERRHSKRFAPIADASTGRWDNRGYFVDACARPQQIVTSAPYLSVTGTSLCVTLTIATRRGDRTIVVGADLDWRRLSDTAPTLLP